MKYVLGDFKLNLLLGIDYVQDIDFFAFFLFRLGLVEQLLPVVHFKAGHIFELLPHSQPFIDVRQPLIRRICVARRSTTLVQFSFVLFGNI